MRRLNGRKVIALVADLTHDEELHFPRYWLEWEGAHVLLAGIQREHMSRFGRPIRVDLTTVELPQHVDTTDAVLIPGGFGPDKLRMDEPTLRFLRRINEQGKPIAAICHAAQVLINAGLVRGRRLTCVAQVALDVQNAGGLYTDQPVVVDGNLITSRLPKDLPGFTQALIDALAARIPVTVPAT